MGEGKRSVVIHGHFYQPPREDPWLEEVERQPSAAPFHDWNARIEDECYRAVVAARVPGEGGRIREVMNTLEFISFNFGPTLLGWLEAKAPDTYRAVLEADRRSSLAHDGHGNAIAQSYHHTILPLASRRDKTTEVRWGITDFRSRFQRDPEGMWLPETAVDEETLDVLAQEGVAFTILAPHQVEQVPENGMPGLFRGANGKTVAVFLYDGPLSHDVAFGHLLKDAALWERRLAEGIGQGRERSAETSPYRSLISIATDGETYGHHHAFGEMALAAVLKNLSARDEVEVENFASYLARNPATQEIRLDAPSSWSCSHGVERWRSECGCKMHPERSSQQAWRTTLRNSMNFLANRLHAVFEAEGVTLLADPWGARNDYWDGSDTTPIDPAHHHEVLRERELLEMERNALRLFTSCGWFFDDMAGIEPLQVLKYAARALELAGPGGQKIEEAFLGHLSGATTNEFPPRDGRTLYLEEVKPKHRAEHRVAAGHAVLRFLGEDPTDRVAGYLSKDTVTAGGGTAATAGGEAAVADASGVGGEAGEPPMALSVKVTHRRTGREWTFTTRLKAPNLGDIQVSLADGVRLSIADLPDGFRNPAEEQLRESIVDKCIPDTDRRDLLLGSRTLDQVAESALVRSIRELPELPSQADEARIVELANLFGLLRQPIPFDAQTEFHRAYRQASPEKAVRLDTLAEPLGCVTTP
jgi:hypothetical protein